MAAGLFCAPLQDRPEIRGVVIEPATNQPVADAEITLDYHGPQQPRIMPSPPKSTVKANTDASGAFVFRPAEIGYFYIRARKDGYGEMSGMPHAPSSQQSVTLSAAQPVREVRLSLSRPGRIAGLVIDEETRKPIANVQLHARRMRQRGTSSFLTGKTASSQADGEFVVTDLAPGDYVIEVMPGKALADRVRSKFSDAELKAVEQDFEHSYWPGGRGPEDAIPVTLSPGATVNIGALPVKKTAYYRVRVHFPALNCGPGDTIGVSQFQRIQSGEESAPLAVVSCHDELLVTGFAPGAWRLIFGLRRAQAEPERASVPFVISDENIEIAASLERPVSIDGAFIAAEGSRAPDLSTVTVSWEGGGGRPYAEPAKPDARGKFQLATSLSESRRLMVYRLGAGGYVKEIRYNGIPVKGDLIPLDKSALTQSLTIVVDDKPASIAGEVVKGRTPVSDALVIVATWPRPDPEGFSPSGFAHAKGDEKGKFQLGGLAPGEYRIVAFAIERLASEDPPIETILRALAASPKIELRAGALQNVEVELNELR